MKNKTRKHPLIYKQPKWDKQISLRNDHVFESTVPPKVYFVFTFASRISSKTKNNIFYQNQFNFPDKLDILEISFTFLLNTKL